MTALWTHSPAPVEYTELVLCRDVFHCTPSQLRAEDAEDILAALACIEAENYVRKQQERSKRR